MDNNLDVKELFAVVAAERLEEARKLDANDEKSKEAFKQCLEAAKMYNELTKTDDSHSEELDRQEMEKEKQELERELRKKENRKDRWVKVAEVGAVAVVAPVVGFLCNKNFAKFLCKVEEFETFTTTAGRSLSKVFKFK